RRSRIGEAIGHRGHPLREIPSVLNRPPWDKNRLRSCPQAGILGTDPEECVNDETLLAVAHRGSPATIDELAALAHTPVDDVTAAVRRLRDRGQLGGRAEEIRYTSPAVWAAESVSSRATQLR